MVSAVCDAAIGAYAILWLDNITQLPLRLKTTESYRVILIGICFAFLSLSALVQFRLGFAYGALCSTWRVAFVQMIDC